MQNVVAVFPHDPQAVLDYTLNWTPWLDGDTIATATWTVDSGLVLDSSSNTTTRAVAWISGGTAGGTYYATCRITTAGGRQDDRTIRLNVEQR